MDDPRSPPRSPVTPGPPRGMADAPTRASGMSLLSCRYETAFRRFLGNHRRPDAQWLFVIGVGSSHALITMLQRGQYCLPFAPYGQSVVLTLRSKT